MVDLVRGLPVDDALSTLQFAPQAASEPVYKVLASAVANAEHTDNLKRDDLYVSQAYVDEGMTMRRIRAAGQGLGQPDPEAVVTTSPSSSSRSEQQPTSSASGRKEA